MLLTATLILGAYLLGSVSSAILVCRLLGVSDPREVGSRNPGATNVLRHAGKPAAAVTLLGDAGKGVLPVLAARLLDLPPDGLALVGCAAFLGHVYPVYYRFSGGKGVATFIGVNLALNPWLGAGFLGAWLLMASLFRYSSLAALAASALTPALAWALGEPVSVVAVLALMGLVVFRRHRANIANLRAGTEKKIGQKA